MSDKKDFDRAFGLIDESNSKHNERLRSLSKDEYCDQLLVELDKTEDVVLVALSKGLLFFFLTLGLLWLTTN